jgi:mannose/fructose/N-acetylgalactosamine-specific phosphotransferase system component IID
MTSTVERPKRLLSKRDVFMAFVRWILLSHSAYNYQRLQGGAFATMMGPLLQKMYPDRPEEVREGLQRHMQFFNTEPRYGAVIHGLVIAMEEERAMGSDIPVDAISDIKTSLMGPLAGLGDTLHQALFIPIMLAICLGWASSGNLLGPILYPVAMVVAEITITYVSFTAGYRYGSDAIERILEGGLLRKITTGASVMGLMVVGTMIVRFVTVQVPLNITIGQTEIALGAGVFDMILPKLVPLLFAVITWRQLASGKSMLKVLLTLAAIGMVFGWLGVLG